MPNPINVNGSTIEWETIDALVESRGRDFPNRHALEVAGTRLTYGEIADHARRVAGNLHRMGVRKGDRVATFMPNKVEQVFTWFGTVKLGAIWVPFNGGLVGDDLAYAIDDTGPSVLVVASELRHLVDAVKVPDGMQKIVAGDEVPAGYLPFDALLAAGDSAPAVKLGPADAAAIMYTGGTTGMPKGAVLPHFAWIAAGYRYRETYRIKPDDSHYSVLKLFHNGGLMLGIIGPMVCLIPSTIDAKFSVSNFWNRIQQTRATVIDMVGTVMVLLTQAPECAEEKDNSVRISLAPIVSVPIHIVEEFRRRFKISLVNLYAQSEAGGIVTIFGDPDSPKLLANGRNRGWAEISIRDERDFALPPGATGQICLRPLVAHIFMKCYHNKPQKTAETFANLWLHTGDYGHMDEDGDLFFTGRLANMVRRRGENISAHEVESVLMHHPDIAEAVILGVPSELSDDEVKAFLIAKPGMTIDPAEIAGWCRSRIAAFKVPRYIQVLDSFPRSAAKSEVERHKLRALDTTGTWDAEREPTAVR
jgi:carnitine-CoA ligase